MARSAGALYAASCEPLRGLLTGFLFGCVCLLPRGVSCFSIRLFASESILRSGCSSRQAEYEQGSPPQQAAACEGGNRSIHHLPEILGHFWVTPHEMACYST